MFPEEKTKKKNDIRTEVTGRFFRNIGTVATALISFVWLFSGFFDVGFEYVSLFKVFLGSLLSVTVAVSIKASMGIQAIKTAMDSIEITDLEKKHKETIDEVNGYIEYVDEWEDQENAMAYSKARSSILAQAGLKYSNYFNETGEYIGEFEIKKLKKRSLEYKQQKKRLAAITKALNLKLTHITFAAVSTQSDVNYDIHDFGETPTAFQKNRVVKKSVGQILSVALGAQITWGFVQGTSGWEALFKGAVQLAVFLVFGAMEYLANWNYVTRDYKENLNKKINAAKRLKNFGEIKQRGEQRGSFES